MGNINTHFQLMGIKDRKTSNRIMTIKVYCNPRNDSWLVLCCVVFWCFFIVSHYLVFCTTPLSLPFVLTSLTFILFFFFFLNYTTTNLKANDSSLSAYNSRKNIVTFVRVEQIACQQKCGDLKHFECMAKQN